MKHHEQYVKGRRAGSASKWFVILGATVIVLWFADFIAGYLVFRHYVNKDGGLHIYERVHVAGYLAPEPRHGCGSGCLLDVVRTPYAYRELYVAEPWDSELHAGTGYQHFYVVDSGDPYCEPFSRHRLRIDVHSNHGLPNDKCIAVRPTENPISRYSYAGTFLEREPTAPSMYEIKVARQAISEISTGRVIAEAVTYQYDPRFYYASIRASETLPSREILIPDRSAPR